MKKEDFLRELDSRLHILNEAERKDIIDEYSQHIDLKIANGLSEEDAAGDFGDIKELAAEILSAYNVNLKYNKPDVTDTCKRIGTRLKKWFGIQKEKLSRGWKRMKSRIKECVDKNNEYSAMRNERKLNQIREENSRRMEREDPVPKQAVTEKKKKNEFAQASLKRIQRAPGNIVRFILKLSVFFVLIPTAIGTVMCLFVFGGCLVLMLQGYPLAGATIGSAGTTMCLGSLSVLFSGYCFGKKGGKIDEKEYYVEEQ